jgi:DNA-directed RNA polymerase subunit RPC12/RpoP
MPDQTLPRNGWEVRANLVCTLCARTVGTARGPNVQPVTLTSVRLVDASHAEAVRRLRCPFCSGRLWLQDREEVYAARHALTGEDLHPRRGRPRKIFRAS